MYGKTVKQLKTMFIVSLILGAAVSLFALIMNLGQYSLLYLIIFALFMVILFPLGIMSFLLNGKKIFVGLIAPVPVISFIKEYFVGLFMAIKAFIWMIKSILKREQ